MLVPVFLPTMRRLRDDLVRADHIPRHDPCCTVSDHDRALHSDIVYMFSSLAFYTSRLSSLDQPPEWALALSTSGGSKRMG